MSLRSDPFVSRRIAPVLPLAAAAILAGLAIARLPRPPWRAPMTPYDLSIPTAARAFRFLSDTARFVPPGVSVAVRSEPADPPADDSLSRMAAALWPGREIVPTAAWGVANPAADEHAEYLVLMGGRPSAGSYDLVFENGAGGVWRRRGVSR